MESHGITQGVVQQLDSADKEFIASARETMQANHMEGYATSVFCLSTTANGWSPFTTLAIVHGSVGK
jgi:hypothetical protein